VNKTIRRKWINFMYNDKELRLVNEIYKKDAIIGTAFRNSDYYPKT
jgi:hypothetical protein